MRVDSAATRLVGKGASDTAQNYGVWTAAGDQHLFFKFHNGTTLQSVSTTTTFSTGTWYHVAVTLGSGQVQFFVNGAAQTAVAATGTPVTSADPPTFGYAGYNGTFGGSLDEVSLFNAVLTSSQVSELYATYGMGLVCRYNVGTDLIGQEILSADTANWTASYYGYDGLGSVRVLYGSTGSTTDTYTYDAFGTLNSSTGSTTNYYRFAGEQWDEDLKLYYNRARYLNPDTGRFTSRDTFEAGSGDTANLHKYVYCHGDSVNGVDPSGHEFTMIGTIMSLATGESLQSFKAGNDTLVQYEMRDMRSEMENSFSFTDLAKNSKLGAAGEKVWVNYLNRNGFRAMVAGNVSANGPDIFATGIKNGRLFVVIGEVKASRSILPGVGKLKWNIVNGFRQMSFGWINNFASDVVNSLVKLGVNGIGEPQLEQLLRAGEIDLYLMGALKESGDRWRIREFEVVHAGLTEAVGGLGGLPEIVTERQVNSKGQTIP